MVVRGAAEETTATEAESAAGPEVIKPERKEKDKED